MRPYIICHTMSSIDARIQGDRWPNRRVLSAFFERTADKISADAWIVGRRTMQEFSSSNPHRLGKPDPSIQKKDFVGQHTTRTYAVVIDPSGKCFWDSNRVSTEHVIEVLTKKVSTAYLKHLQEKQVSYVFAGETNIDLELAVKKLNQLFGIRRARIDGGGTVNGTFLKAGLVDEISHVVLPVADGSMETPTIFDVEKGHTKRMAKKLRLKSIKRLPGDVLWIRYLINNE